MEHRGTKDMSSIYMGYKDMNEWQAANREYAIGQGIQDVFLLPQKQTCFTPDGRKEGKIKNYVFKIKSRVRPISI